MVQRCQHLGFTAESRDALGKRELLKALGGDRQVALRALPVRFGTEPGAMGVMSEFSQSAPWAHTAGLRLISSIASTNCAARVRSKTCSD